MRHHYETRVRFSTRKQLTPDERNLLDAPGEAGPVIVLAGAGLLATLVLTVIVFVIALVRFLRFLHHRQFMAALSHLLLLIVCGGLATLSELNLQALAMHAR